MIDESKYEGHTPAPWRVENGSIHAKADWWSGAGDMIFFSKRHGQDANSQLMADAPLLLAEVKRLREGIEHVLHIRLRHGQEEGWEELYACCAVALKELIE